jgi:hypothetical protein
MAVGLRQRTRREGGGAGGSLNPVLQGGLFGWAADQDDLFGWAPDPEAHARGPRGRAGQVNVGFPTEGGV